MRTPAEIALAAARAKCTFHHTDLAAGRAPSTMPGVFSEQSNAEALISMSGRGVAVSLGPPGERAAPTSFTWTQLARMHAAAAENEQLTLDVER